jgi:hypothetical protein
MMDKAVRLCQLVRMRKPGLRMAMATPTADGNNVKRALIVPSYVAAAVASARRSFGLRVLELMFVVE